MSAITATFGKPAKGILTQRLAFILLAAATVIVIVPVIYIVGFIVINGAGAISWDFISQMPRRRGLEGGLLPAIAGTFFLMAGTAIFSVPVGLLAAIYLTEYAKQSVLTRIINLSIVNLAGVPSIVFGMFGLSLFVLLMGMGSSLLAASLTLAAQALAMIITTSREALKAVAAEHREGSLALGVTKWSTIQHVVLPQALPGIITGVVLAIGRAAGETAPILAVGVAFMLNRLPVTPMDHYMALPYHLYVASTQIPGMPETRQWGIALVLLAVVLMFNLAAILIRIRARKQG